MTGVHKFKPTNRFSARWSGIVQPLVQGDHVFSVVSATGDGFRLRVNGTVIIDNWTNPTTNTMAGTNWLGTNTAYDLTLEYAHFTNAAQVRLLWREPGMATNAVIDADRFVKSSYGATGVSMDSSGKIWAACYDSSSAVRINPNAGPLVVTDDGQTNHVGLVDMVVDLGDANSHPEPYNQAAHPYNYSDMTGLNVRVVNPGLQPLKGYWMAIDDSGYAGQLWQRISWNADVPTNGCSIEVYARAADARTSLGSANFVLVTNDVDLPLLRGRYIEVRLALARDNPASQPVLYDLTLHGTSSGFAGDRFVDDARAYETQDAMFYTTVTGVEPMSYQWYVQYPWTNEWVLVTNATNIDFTLTNVDSWVDGTAAGVLVTNGNNETLWLGPAYLEVVPVTMHLPATNYTGNFGPATRYPATINVFGQPTNLDNVIVTLSGLSHTRTADLSVLLVSPLGTNIMLMSNVGGTNGVSGATLIFQQYKPSPPDWDPIQSWQTSYFQPSNDGQKTQLSGAPDGPYSIDFDDLKGKDPNRVWKLYIYDDGAPGGVGDLTGSWKLDFTFQ